MTNDDGLRYVNAHECRVYADEHPPSRIMRTIDRMERDHTLLALWSGIVIGGGLGWFIGFLCGLAS